MVKRNDVVRFVNFELEDRPTVRKFMEENREVNFTVDSVWSESERLIFLKGVKNYFQEQCLAVPRFNDLDLILPVEVSVKKDVESTLTQVDVRDGERLVAILYLRPEELHLVVPMLTESYDNVSFRRIDEPPF